MSADCKWASISSDVKVRASGAKITQVKVDPLIYGIGVGYRF